jgi:hypothetical protein
MSVLLNETPAASEWVDIAARRHSGRIFGSLVPAVVWSDARGDDGELLVPADPVELASAINGTPHALFNGHDPGKPIGQVLEAANFETESGTKFVAAIFGYYAGGEVISFRGLGLDAKASAASPATLPELPDGNWIQLATDPREVDEAWLEEVASDAPLPIKRTELSHNAADSIHELIGVGVVYLSVVWNPFVTAIASEAGKATYAAIHAWLRKLLEKLAKRRNPILALHSIQNGCQVSFLFRGRDVKPHYAALAALPSAAAQAAELVAKLKALGMTSRQLVYEFDKESGLWSPSYAILNDNRIITDNIALIAIEQLPKGVSLGLGGGKAFFPVVRSTPDEDDDGSKG